MTEEAVLRNASHGTAAYDWFPRVADELELLEAGPRSWRTAAAERLRAVAHCREGLRRDDGALLAVVAVELAAGEDEGALANGLVTWRTLAADELAELARSLRPEAVIAAGE
jgi:hypothetical protein